MANKISSINSNSQGMTVKILIVVPIVLLLILILCAPSQAEDGVIFDEVKVLLSKKSFKKLGKQFIESHFDKDKGVNELRFSLGNTKGAVVNYVIQQKNGKRILEKIDADRDGFFEVIKRKVTNQQYTYEELISLNSSKIYHLRKRFYPVVGSHLVRLQISRLESKKGEFKVIEETFTSSIEMAEDLARKRQCLNNSSFYLDSTLIDSVNDIINDYGIDWPGIDDFDVVVDVEFDRSCNQKTSAFLESGKKFSQIYAESINEGMSCLQDLASDGRDSASFSNLLYLNSAASLAGQKIYETPMNIQSMNGGRNGFPRRANANDFQKQKVLCSQRGSAFAMRDGSSEVGHGLASTGVAHSTKLACEGGELNIRHPFISLNFDRLQDQANSTNTLPLRDRERFLKQLIFHEFLHTTGAEHNRHYDPVSACAIYCFNGARTNEANQASKSLCQGENMGGFSLESIKARVENQVSFLDSLNYTMEPVKEVIARELRPQLGATATSSIMSQIGK